jgi:nucleotide-binding universal stress UspA family protein
MFDNVVVGVDDHDAGRDALDLAKRLVFFDGSLLLVFVEVVRPAPFPGTHPERQAAERGRALERLASLRDEARVDAELLAVQAGSVASGLHEVVDRRGDLLVIGASRRDGLERVFVGDDTRQVLEGSPSAVAVAPRGYAARRPLLNKIGVAYNGSPESEEALAVASELAREHNAELSAFEAVPEPIYVHDPRSGQWELDERLVKAYKRLDELGDVQPRVATGDAAQALARYAASVDLLVLGSHEHRSADRFTGGSTSQRLAHNAPCPLLVLAARGGAPPRGAPG